MSRRNRVRRPRRQHQHIDDDTARLLAHAVALAPGPLGTLTCPHCGSTVDQPGYVEWSARFLGKEGYLPPPEPAGVPGWAWWWCPGCTAGGCLLPG